ncbi:MAG: hypothetical protein CL609_23285 [Anaerolineaceae bacterium]|nr:hypothetical protein [Anaerolineaceae bacterium]
MKFGLFKRKYAVCWDKINEVDLTEIIQKIIQISNYFYYQTLNQNQFIAVSESEDIMHSLKNGKFLINGETINEGRFFGSECDFQFRKTFWRNDDANWVSGWKGLYIGKKVSFKKSIPIETIDNNLSTFKQDEITIKLFGVKNGSDEFWIDPRIPKQINYPNVNYEKVGLTIIKYSKNEEVLFTQWIGFEKWGEYHE